MTATELRRQSDIELINQLSARSRGAVAWLKPANINDHEWLIALQLPTSADRHYPQSVQKKIELKIQLPARYPFAAPVVKITSAIFHPNVFANGTVCLGTQWAPSEGLDLFLTRIGKLIIYDPLYVNSCSAANGAANAWYRLQSGLAPDSFPSISRRDVGWLYEPRSQTDTAEHAVRACTQCQQKMRLPIGRSGTVTCPSCKRDVQIST
jgi:ubiquitin-protein ligase